VNRGSERSHGVAVVVGLARGVVGGTGLAVLPLVAQLLADRSGIALESIGLFWVGLVLAACSLAVADTLSGRCESPWVADGVRFLGGLFAPALGAMPFFSLLNTNAWPALARPSELALDFAAVAVSLGLGQAFAGPTVRSGEREPGCGRALVSASVAGAVAGVVFGLWHGEACGGLLGGFFASYLVLGSLAVVNALAADRVAARVARWLEPEDRHTDLESAEREQAREVALARAALDEVRRGAGRGFLETALVHARAARDAGAGRVIELPPHPVTRLLIEVFLELGRLDEAEGLVTWVTFAGPIRAEIARLRGDPAGAIARANAGLASPVWIQGAKQQAATASFEAVLALAEADRGNEAAAQEHLARAREVPPTVERALERLTVASVEAALARGRP
jgi:hypothetical protein